ncbi:hypothetical protein JL722_14457 [Aureococcus anophagefferens]|nr:hypothetical protein JL722_14457 [Aureococcus anophagefferens]
MKLTVYAAADNGVVRRWDDLSTVLSAALLRLEDGAVARRRHDEARSTAVDPGDAAAAPLASGGGGVRALASDGSRLVAGDEDGRIRIWRVDAEPTPSSSDGDDGDLGDALAIDYAGEPADPFAPVLVAKLDARADPASNAILQLRDVGRGGAVSAPVDLAVPRWGPTTTAGVAENCEGCGTSISWTGGWQSACPVCGPSAVVNACALSPDGAAVLAGGYDRALTCWAPPPPPTPPG